MTWHDRFRKLGDYKREKNQKELRENEAWEEEARKALRLLPSIQMVCKEFCDAVGWKFIVVPESPVRTTVHLAHEQNEGMGVRALWITVNLNGNGIKVDYPGDMYTDPIHSGHFGWI